MLLIIYILQQISWLWEVPATIVLAYHLINITFRMEQILCYSYHLLLSSLAVLYSFNSFIATDSQIVFFLPHRRCPLWFVVLFVSLCLAVAHFILEKEPPQTDGEQIATILVAFVTSVFLDINYGRRTSELSSSSGNYNGPATCNPRPYCIGMGELSGAPCCRCFTGKGRAACNGNGWLHCRPHV